MKEAHVQTPPAISAALERIAEEKASKIIRDCKTAVIMNICPEWMRADEAEAFFGIPANQLKKMAKRGDVSAKKMDPHLTQSAVIFKVSDVRKAIEKLTPYAEWCKTRPDINTQTKGN